MLGIMQVSFNNLINTHTQYETRSIPCYLLIRCYKLMSITHTPSKTNYHFHVLNRVHKMFFLVMKIVTCQVNNLYKPTQFITTCIYFLQFV